MMHKCSKYDALDSTCRQCEINEVEEHNSCYKPNKVSNNDVKNIDHPSHYNSDDRMECIEEMRILFGDEAVISFCKLNAYKYYYRAGNKAGEAEKKDKAKAMWYLKKVAELMKDGVK